MDPWAEFRVQDAASAAPAEPEPQPEISAGAGDPWSAFRVAPTTAPAIQSPAPSASRLGPRVPGMTQTPEQTAKYEAEKYSMAHPEEANAANQAAAQQAGFGGRLLANAASAGAHAGQQVQAGWKNLVGGGGIYSILDPESQPNRPEDQPTIMSEENLAHADQIAAGSGAVTRFAGGLSAMPVTMLTPQAIAAALITHSPNGVLAQKVYLSRSMGAISAKYGEGAAQAVEKIITSSGGMANFSATQAALEGKDIPEIAQAAGEGAIAGAGFGAAGAAMKGVSRGLSRAVVPPRPVTPAAESPASAQPELSPLFMRRMENAIDAEANSQKLPEGAKYSPSDQGLIETLPTGESRTIPWESASEEQLSAAMPENVAPKRAGTAEEHLAEDLSQHASAHQQIAEEAKQESVYTPDEVASVAAQHTENPIREGGDEAKIAKDTAAEKGLQLSNIDTLDHRGEFVERDVPIDQLDLITPADEATVKKYAGKSAETAPPVVVGPAAEGSAPLSEGKTLLVADGKNRIEAAKARGETTVKAFVPKWFAEQGTEAPEAMGAAQAGTIPPTRMPKEVIASPKPAKDTFATRVLSTLTGAAKGTKEAGQEGLSQVKAAVSRNAAPRTAAIDKEAANAVVSFAAARQTAEPLAKSYVSEVLPTQYKNEAFRTKLGAVLQESKLRATFQKHVAAGNDPAAAEVGTLVGPKGAFKDEAAFQDARQDPAIQEAIKRHIAGPQEDLQGVHEALGGPLDVLDEHGAFINAKALDPNNPQEARRLSGGGRGNLRNQRIQRSAFTRTNMGSGTAYELDYQKQLEHGISGNIERAAKKHMVDTLVDRGLAKLVAPGTKVKFAGGDGVAIQNVLDYSYVDAKSGEVPFARNVKKDLVVDPRIATEIRNSLNVDSPVTRKAGLGLLPHILSGVQLKGPVDFIAHTSRIMAQITASPKDARFLQATLRKIPGLNLIETAARIGTNIARVLQDNPEVRDQIAELTAIGQISHGGHKGLMNVIRTAGQVALDNVYQDLVKTSKGGILDTQENRRNFGLQTGQYNSRLQTRVVRVLRESGASPFITAGLSGNMEGIKAMLGDPIVRGATRKATAKMWASHLAGNMIGLVVIPALVNYHTTGKLAGRVGVPVGAIDTGEVDEQKRPIYIDPLKHVGFRRGLQSTGIDAMIDRLRAGGSVHNAMTDAFTQARDSWVRPFAGPAVRTAVIASTGYDVSGRRVAPLVPPGVGRNQVAENAKAAIKQLNPTVEAYFRGEEQSGTTGGGIKETMGTVSRSLGIGARKAVPEGARGGAELNAFRDDLKARAKRLKPDERLPFIHKQLKGMSAKDRAKIYQDMTEHPHSWLMK